MAEIGKEKQPHVANIDFVEFYRLAFANQEGARRFVEEVEQLPPSRNTPKVALHQAARMLWLADRIEEVARGRPALQILFFLIAAEAVAKIVFGFKGEGKSRYYVHRFFAEICSQEHRDRLASAFSTVGRGHFSCEETVNYLYDVRCDVVHEGMYFGMNLKLPGDTVDTLTQFSGRSIIAHITAKDIRQIVLEGSVLGCRKLLKV